MLISDYDINGFKKQQFINKNGYCIKENQGITYKHTDVGNNFQLKHADALNEFITRNLSDKSGILDLDTTKFQEVTKIVATIIETLP